MGKPILSICIPTANRSNHLKRVIESIVCQEPFLNGEVEIVISDNSDDDNTRKLLLHYQQPGINYYKNETNIYAINFARSLSLGNGTYRKLANDTIYYNERSLVKMVEFVKENEIQRPVLLWKSYHHYGINYLKTMRFEESLRAMSYFSTWIASYGIWNDEENAIIDSCIKARDNLRDRIRTKNSNDIVSRNSRYKVDITHDTFWQLRRFAESYNERKVVVLKNCAVDWCVDNPPKYYYKGGLKWTFYDYYMDILREFVGNGLISDSCVTDLERDIAFSFFVNYMIDVEFPFTGIKYDEDETLIDDILQEYSTKPYFDKLYGYYQERRQAKIEELKASGGIQ